MTETLTADDIRTMPAGTELDLLVVERVMGCRILSGHEQVDETIFQGPYPLAFVLPAAEMGDHPAVGKVVLIRNAKDAGNLWRPWSPSTDIAAAWEVVESLAGKGCAFALSVHDCLWTMLLTRTTRPRSNCICTGETAPLTICRAALLAVMEF